MWAEHVTKQQLLTASDPAPVSVLRPNGASDFFLTVDHAGRAVPKKLGKLGLPDAELTRHIAWDIGISGVAERLSAELDATAVFQTYSRLVIDCNRGHDAPSFIPRVSEATEIPGNLNLSNEGRIAREREIFVPYHAQIRALLDAREKAGRITVLLALHSFTPVYLGEKRAMEVAVLYRVPRFAHILLGVLREEPGLIVADNEPYSVSDSTDYTIPMHGERRGIPHTGIEIRQDLLSTAGGEAEWAARLSRMLPLARAKLG